MNVLYTDRACQRPENCLLFFDEMTTYHLPAVPKESGDYLVQYLRRYPHDTASRRIVCVWIVQLKSTVSIRRTRSQFRNVQLRHRTEVHL
jgi:hypothetical protein